MDNLHDFARRVLEAQPFSALIGAELTQISSGSAELRLSVRDELKQQHGLIHGGVISYLADNSLTFAGGSILGDSVTSEFKINYLKPGKGNLLIARAEAISYGRRQAVCQCRIFTVEDDETLVAMAQGTIVALLR